MTIGTTWAGTHTFGAGTLHLPTTMEEAQHLVAGADRIRALGSRHSFNDLADSPGDLISLREVPLGLEVDAENGSATVHGSLTYGAVAAELDAAGFAMPALASLPHISIAGAVATATHGSGDRTPNLAGVVTAVEMIGADGELLWLERGDADFPGAVVALGALGVVTRLRLAVEPTFGIRQDVLNEVRWETVLERFDEITAAAHSVSIFTRWAEDAVDQIWIKSRDDVAPAELFGGVFATTRQHPILGVDAINATEQGGTIGPWYDRLPHFRMGFTPSNGSEIQSEYLMDRRHAVAAIEALRGLREQLIPLLQVCEIRTMAADDLWLSAAYERDTVAFHFTWHAQPDAVQALLPEVERALAPFAARPHWGKWFAMGREELEQVFPRIGDFRALAARLDPTGTFRNAYLDRLVL
ncbi:D-arabinono-1,4-lactone oxidase [Pseudactinotalea sp.]|uniref:D-arabinono-1,4-lactone oxidase n=1 Tax=Pseudactinotalea sp. TaxID=1926260 RepID=UPI003B3B0DCC